MFLSAISDGGATPALIKTLSFNEKRMRMIAENVANIQTPGYRAKQLDVKAFQRALGEALNERRSDATSRFDVSVGGEVATDEFGFLQVTPSERPVDNILFHDGTNLSIDREMADLAETGMVHEMVSTLLNSRFEGLRKAIRGTVR